MQEKVISGQLPVISKKGRASSSLFYIAKINLFIYLNSLLSFFKALLENIKRKAQILSEPFFFN